MSGDYTEMIELLEEININLETVISNQEAIIPLLEIASSGIGYLICFIVVIIVITLLKYAYKFLDIFF